jgi:muramidase (phage lysozyme)
MSGTDRTVQACLQNENQPGFEQLLGEDFIDSFAEYPNKSIVQGPSSGLCILSACHEINGLSYHPRDYFNVHPHTAFV